MNSSMGDSAKFVVTGSNIQLGRIRLSLWFDQPVVNHPDNDLSVSICFAPNSFSPDVQGPVPFFDKLCATATDEPLSIVWVGARKRFNNTELVEFLFAQLVRYYLEHTRR